MTKSVLIVESPAKGKTIEGYLGKGYKVIASYGHVRDLPKSKLGIDVEHNFEPQYMVPRGSAAKIKALQKAVKDADIIYLATDLDREGEAIAWHLAQILEPTEKQQMKRITFSEITKPALEYAVAHPRDVNQDLVDAQQARRVLDRLVGYSLSPVLWKKVRYGLSAGRVQSVALKIIVDREKEILAFKAEEYWSIAADLKAPSGELTANLMEVAGKKAEPKDEKTSTNYVEDLKSASYQITSVEKKPVKRNPQAPYTTSTLQQDAYRRLGYGTRRTMGIAQKLYEAGLISYMRTDSVALSAQALASIKNTLTKEYGKQYVLPKARVHKTKSRGAQEAHEAIRPTNPGLLPEQVTDRAPEELKLYTLIWQRTLASQMPEAQFEQTRIDIQAKGKETYLLRTSGRILVFDGYTKVYPMQKKDDDPILPPVVAKDKLDLIKVDGEQHFTQPPARFSEATLVKKLEEAGVGRPSTYAPTIATIINRGYVLNEDKRLMPQPTGMVVSDLLSEHFDFVTDPEFTAKMEDQLDAVADGTKAWQPVIKEYYDPMHELIEEKQDIPRTPLPVIETDIECDVCGKMMVIKSGRFGQFYACSGWPDCKNAKPILKKTGIECEKCHEGELVERKTKKGRRFWGCSRYPDCDFATWVKPKDPNAEASGAGDTEV